MGLKFRRGTTAQKSGSLAFGEPYVNTTLGTLQIGGDAGDITLGASGTGSQGSFAGISGSSLDITGNTKIDGNLTLGGNITIGDNTADSVNVVASLSSSLIPSITNAFDLGSATNIWRDLYISTGSIKFVGAGGNVLGTLTNTGNGLNLDGGVVTNGNSSFGTASVSVTSVTGSLRVSGSLTTIGESTATSFNGAINATNGVVSGSSQTIANLPTGVVSGSSQTIANLPTGTVSGSSQITYASISSIPGGIVSGSAQTILNLPTGTVSGSSQVTLSSTTGGTTSSNVQFNSLGIGMAASATAGRIDATNDVVAFSSSDIRFKENITPIENALDKISKISGNTYDWKAENKIEHGYEGNDVGVIAQEIEAVLPQLVQTRENGFKAVKYDKLVALLIEGIKEQQQQIEKLRMDLDNYECKCDNCKSK